eukprot:1826856-Lingulodinium_polyedra.AAC.1
MRRTQAQVARGRLTAEAATTTATAAHPCVPAACLLHQLPAAAAAVTALAATPMMAAAARLQVPSQLSWVQLMLQGVPRRLARAVLQALQATSRGRSRGGRGA